jgi:Protein of unknown function (DUF3179)
MKGVLLLPIVGLLILAACSDDDGDAENGATDVSRPPMAEQLQPTPQTAQSEFSRLAGSNWSTEFSKASVRPAELTRGQIKDGIPAISDPKFLPVAETTFLKDQEPVIAFEEGGEVRAYPLQILTWHEIVNDTVGRRPVLITFCPLCNTAIAFDRTVNGRVLEFGVSGFLRNSDLVMFDRFSETWWQQVTGEAIVGELTETKLELLSSTIVSWADFKAAFPDGSVLSRETGHSRSYGTNPYVGYDDVNSSPFLFDGKADSRLAAMERVVTVELGGEVSAYPFSRLESQPVVNDMVGGQAIVVFFKPGTVSALDRSSIADSRDVGSAAVFSPDVDGRKLTFWADGSGFKDAETSSTWDIFGRATTGPLKGRALTPVVSGNHFWFAWAAFKPETRVWQ